VSPAKARLSALSGPTACSGRTWGMSKNWKRFAGCPPMAVCPRNRYYTLRFLGREDDRPVRLHVDDRPAAGCCSVQRAIEPADGRGAIIGPFTLGVGVMHDQSKPSPGACRHPLEHL